MAKYHQKPTKTMSAEHIEQIRKAAQARHKNHDVLCEMNLDKRWNPGDNLKPETVLKNYFVQLNVSILSAKRHNYEVDIPWVIKSLQKKLFMDLQPYWGDLVLFFAQYNTGLITLDETYPFPYNCTILTKEVYQERADKIIEYRKSGIEHFQEIVNLKIHAPKEAAVCIS